MKLHEGAPKCPRCNDRVYFGEERKALGKSWHTRCFTCCQCKKSLSSTNYNEFEGELMCTACNRRYAGAAKPSSATATPAPTTDTSPPAFTTQQSVRAVNRDDPENCPHCGLRVYFAEEVKALKRKWHRICFKCQSCKKTLEPSRCTEHQGQLYCQPCHGKQFGHPGYGFAGGAGSVFPADNRASNGLAYSDTLAAGDEVPMTPVQPIKGTQEWTDVWEYNPQSRDKFT
jgi:cysteine/glycine-rich protein